MDKISDMLSAPMKKAFAECGYDEKYGTVITSTRPDLCEFQCNGSMAAAKEYRKAPFMIANEVVEKVKDNSMFKSVEVVNPGFINIILNDEFIADYINEMKGAEKLGCLDIGKGKTIVVDYGGPNVAKPLHIGHLRPAIIGESVKRIKRFSGYNVIGDVHLGDWGLQMGLVIEALIEKYPSLTECSDIKQGIKDIGLSVSDLETLYPEASARSKVDEDFSSKAHKATNKLQSYDERYYAIWQEIVNLSVSDLKKNYDKLDVDFDVWKGESDAQPFIAPMIEDLKNKGVLYESDGAMVVSVAEESDQKAVPPCIIVKSDGSALYATTDLATIIDREKEYKPSEIIYVVDGRQSMHFTQVFRVSRKVKLVPDDTKLIFIGFGTMNGSDGKPFKTRDGGVMRLESLIADINEKIASKLNGNDEINELEAADICAKIGLAALKYGDLSNQASKNYVFDIDRFCEFEGNTGPYILYTMVRINSILKKFAKTNQDDISEFKIKAPMSKSEKDLCMLIAKLSEVTETACKENAPHKICQYIYNISNEFNHLYHEVKILSENDKEKQKSYIATIKLTYDVLDTCIDLLGFSAPDKM